MIPQDHLHLAAAHRRAERLAALDGLLAAWWSLARHLAG